MKLNLNFALFIMAAFLASCSTEEIAPTANDDQYLEEESSNFQPYVIDNDITNARAPEIFDWTMIWNDEFRGNNIDLDKWNVTVSSKTRNPRWDKGIHDWRWSANNVYLDGRGKLILRSEKTGANSMRCGSIDSRDDFRTKYGFFESRILVANTAKANHTAFWLQGANQGGVDGTAHDGAEVDIFESAWTGDYTKAVVHIDGYGQHHRANTIQYSTPRIHRGYHIYGLDWSESRMHIYYDGEKKATYTGIWVPRAEEWLWVSVGASFGDGDFLSQPIGQLSVAKVDYVRVYKKGLFRLVNKQTGKWLRANGSDNDTPIVQANANQRGDWTTWSRKNSSNGYFYFINEGTEKYFRPVSNTNNAGLVLKDTGYGGAWTQWKMVGAGSGYFYIINRQTGKYIRPSSSSNGAAITLSANKNGDWTKWRFDYLDD